MAAAAAAVAASSGAPVSSPPPPPPLPAVAPALQPFVVPAPHTIQNSPPGMHNMTVAHAQHHQHAGAAVVPGALPVATGHVPGITTLHGTISGQALEDSLFRFLTPATGDAMHPLPAPATTPTPDQAATNQAQNVNHVAAKAGANPITLPSGAMPPALPCEGEVSPTGVADLGVYPSWAEAAAANAPPAWYARGADVDELLNEADALDWLADSGDLQETYAPTGQAQRLSEEDTEPNPVVGTVAPASMVKASDVASLCSETTVVAAPANHGNHPVPVSSATPNPVMAQAPFHAAVHQMHAPVVPPAPSASDLPALPSAHNLTPTDQSIAKIESHSSMPPLPSLFSGVDMSSVVAAAAASSAHSTSGVSLAPEEAAAVAGVPIPKKEEVVATLAPPPTPVVVDPAQQPSPSASSTQVYGSATEAADAAAAKASGRAVVAPALAGGATAAADAVAAAHHPAADEHLAVFDAHFDEQAFVSALLENNGESSASLPALQ
uniref:Ataxin-2 C-terminal domain-containing protein n=1 Tax=Odontella aurita TaxID=265563 RepID=A0A7S4I225_9STRA